MLCSIPPVVYSCTKRGKWKLFAGRQIIVINTWPVKKHYSKHSQDSDGCAYATCATPNSTTGGPSFWCSALARAVCVGIDTSTARWTGSDGGRGREGVEAGGSKPATIVGGVEGRSGVVGGGTVDWRPPPRYGTRKSRNEARRDPTLRRKCPGACGVTGTSVAPDMGSIPPHPFSRS